MTDRNIIIIIIAASIISIILLLWKVKSLFEGVKSIAEDTLKVWDDKEKRLKWSATKWTMFVAFGTAICMGLYDSYKNGLDEFVFGALLTVALTGKVTNAWSKKIDPTIVAPKEEA